MALMLRINTPLDPNTKGKTLVGSDSGGSDNPPADGGKSPIEEGTLPELSSGKGFIISCGGIPSMIGNIFTPVGDVTAPGGARMVVNPSSGTNE